MIVGFLSSDIAMTTDPGRTRRDSGPSGDPLPRASETVLPVIAATRGASSHPRPGPRPREIASAAVSNYEDLGITAARHPAVTTQPAVFTSTAAASRPRP